MLVEQLLIFILVISGISQTSLVANDATLSTQTSRCHDKFVVILPFDTDIIARLSTSVILIVIVQHRDIT